MVVTNVAATEAAGTVHTSFTVYWVVIVLVVAGVIALNLSGRRNKKRGE